MIGGDDCLPWIRIPPDAAGNHSGQNAYPPGPARKRGLNSLRQPVAFAYLQFPSFVIY
jgi:hypothetical protein